MARMVAVVLLAAALFAGCSALQAGPEEVAQARQHFFDLVDNLNKEAKNGAKVLAESRELERKGEINRTKVQNTIIQGQELNDRITDDFIQAGVPADLEPYRERALAALKKREEAYKLLFDAYDTKNPKLAEQGDAALQEALQAFDQLQKDLAPLRK